MISVIIPARYEKLLQNTIDDLFKNAGTEIEIIVVLDGYWADPPLKPHQNLVIVHHGESKGMRAAINTAARVAKGDFLLKCDAHCAFSNGFGKQLLEDYKPYWTIVPVRYSLDSVNWTPKLDKKYEFEYISSEDLKGKRWPEFAERVEGQTLVDLMTFQGSCWFMSKEFFNLIEGLDEINYGSMGREAQEIGLKTWLLGGRLVLDRNLWYAHWSKAKKDIRFSNKKEKEKSVKFATDFWLNDNWDKATRKLGWLIKKFSPVPTWEQMPTGVIKLPKEVLKDWPKQVTTRKDYTMDEKELEVNLFPFGYKLVEKGRPELLMLEGMGRAKMYKMFDKLGFKIGAEIGVQRGRNAWVMFQNMPNLEKLYLIEPYADHPSNFRSWGEKTHAKFKKQAHERLKDYPVEWIEGFSENVSSKIKDRTLDFVYIDGEHTYDFVMIDLILWSRKVRINGIISGHDYAHWKPHQFKVPRAVNDFIGASDYSPLFITDNNVRDNTGDRCASFFIFKTHK